VSRIKPLVSSACASSSAAHSVPVRGLRNVLDAALRQLAALVAACGLSLAVSCAVVCFPPSASADDLNDFEEARSLYDKRNYAGAAAAFKQMVGTDPPRVTERLLVLESRKYLAASLLFLGQQDDARAQFRLLLAQEPGYALDPLSFPTDVVTLFEKVKVTVHGELEQAREAEVRQREEEQRKQLEARQTEQENLRRLLNLASEAQTNDQHSRWIATIPFGAGQFQNGRRNLGVAFAVLEGISAATSIGSYLAHQQVADDRPGSGELGETRRLETLWRNTNNISFGVFAALALIGVIDAHVRFVPARVTSRPRQLPPDLERWARERKLSTQGFTLHF